MFQALQTYRLLSLLLNSVVIKVVIDDSKQKDMDVFQ